MSESPLWRQAFDAAEKRVTPHADQLVRTPAFALAAALTRRTQAVVRGTARGVTARAWHLVNLPAGSDISRLRAQVGALDREVRRLTVQLETERRRAPAATAPTEEETRADRAQPSAGPRPRPPRRGTQRAPGS
jgi:hypothetical protein